MEFIVFYYNARGDFILYITVNDKCVKQVVRN